MIPARALISHRTWCCSLPLVQLRRKPALNQTPTPFVQQFLKTNKRGKSYGMVGKPYTPEKYREKKGKCSLVMVTRKINSYLTNYMLVFSLALSKALKAHNIITLTQ